MSWQSLHFQNNIERARPYEDCRKTREFYINNTMKQREKQRYVRMSGLARMQRSLHAQIPDGRDASEMPSTSWQRPQSFHLSEARARSTERTPASAEATGTNQV